MPSLVTAGVRSVAGKMTRSALVTRTSRPPAVTVMCPSAELTGAQHRASARRYVARGSGGAREVCAEELETAGPAARRADGVAHGLPAGPVTVEVPVLELNPSSRGALGGERDLDLARARRVGLEFPLRGDVPADHGEDAERAVDRRVHNGRRRDRRHLGLSRHAMPSGRSAASLKAASAAFQKRSR